VALVFVWHWCCLEVGCGQVVLGGKDCPGSWSSGNVHGKDLLGAVGLVEVVWLWCLCGVGCVRGWVRTLLEGCLCGVGCVRGCG